MRHCLYCQHDTTDHLRDCPQCGMPLPAATVDARLRRRQRCFLWFCVGLTLFCLVMMLWLPRTILG
ncbi:hypothetical protein D3C71_2061280 [compost metagenome]